MISVIRDVTIGVSDLDKASRFFRQALGYHETDRGRVEDKEWLCAWRVPAGVAADYAILAPEGARDGRLRLLACSEPGERIWGDYGRRQDLGHFAVNFRVPEIQVGWQRLLEAGAEPRSEPTYWMVNDEISAWDSQCFGPDGVLLDVFEIEGAIVERLGEQVTAASEVQTVAIHVSDMARSQALYEALGFKLLYDQVVENLEEFFHIPPGTRLHNVNLFKPGQTPNGRIELVEYRGWKGSPVGERAAPPNHGILGISLATDDLETTGRSIEERGAVRVTGPVILYQNAFGIDRLATFVGPDGEFLELYEPN